MSTHGSPPPAPGDPPAAPASRSRRRVRIAIAGGSALALAVAAVAVRYRSCTGSMTDALAQQDLARTLGPRLSLQTEYRPCRPKRSSGLIPSSECEDSVARTDDQLRSLERRIRVLADSGRYDAVHADALLDVIDRNPPSALSRAIDRLRLLVRMGYHEADSLADVSAAFLVRAGREQSTTDLMAAAGAAVRALEIDSRHPAAMFNLALAFEAMTLDEDARRMWTAFLVVEPEGGYAREAHAHLNALERKPIPVAGADAPDSTLATFAAANPQGALELGWNVVLDRWAGAVLRGDTSAARAALRRAGLLGRTLESRRGGDASLADAVRAIERHAADSAAIRRLATAHHLYAAGRAAQDSSQFARTDSLLSRAAPLAIQSPPLAGWIAAFLPGARHYTDPAAADRLARAAVARVDTLRYPALAGRTYWIQATVTLRTLASDPAERGYQVAARLFQRAGEMEHAASMIAGEAEAQFQRSDPPEQYLTTWLRAATMLRPYRTRALHRPLADLSQWLVMDGEVGLARRVSEEDVAIGRKSGVPVVLTEALAFHAQALAQSRDASGVRALAVSADSLLPRLAPAAREYFAADLRATRAIADPLHNPREVDAALSKVIPQMSRAGVPIRLISAYLARAKARTELAWTDLARADVQEAYRLIEQGRESKPDGVSRSLGSDARATLMGVVGTLVAQHREAEGLELLEFSQSPEAADSIGAHAGRIPPGTVAIRYARLGDSLVAWTASAKGVQFTALPVSAAEVDATLDSALTLLAERRGEPRLLLHLAGLYDDLIRPLEPRLAGGDTMVVIADGKLADVPFAALRHALANQFLVEEHLVRQATSLARVAGRDSVPRPGRVGIVLNPLIDGTLHPRLPPLPSARGESAAVAGWWSRRRDGSVAWSRSELVALAGAEAREDDVQDLLEKVSVLHFAGHAIADPEDPDSSQLVLAPGPDYHQLGRLTAAQVARMDLSRLDLVVLSACYTLGGDRSGAGGFAGLGGAFLGAGARGVIGSLWEVDDALTGELMTRFYEEYGSTTNAAVALRNAQLSMLRDHNARYSPPWAWAGFEYAGS